MTTESTTPTTTIATAQGGRVILRFTRLVGSEYLTPDQARAKARILLELADEAEAQARHAEN